jgi:hypothetical protein
MSIQFSDFVYEAKSDIMISGNKEENIIKLELKETDICDIVGFPTLI